MWGGFEPRALAPAPCHSCNTAIAIRPYFIAGGKRSGVRTALRAISSRRGFLGLTGWFWSYLPVVCGLSRSRLALVHWRWEGFPYKRGEELQCASGVCVYMYMCEPVVCVSVHVHV